ncbi:uncharacterized protein [Amphiura filiformis]|uniref:uncharacterized protein n=1 Tax=Amphiura filiformis TaxID=82378 RepID=UPI003B20D4BF
MKFYNVCVLSTLLYASECWTLTERDESRLDTVDLRIKWTQHITNDFIRSLTKQQKLTTIIKKRHLQWFGHLLRMDESRIPRKLYFWNPTPGRPRSSCYVRQQMQKCMMLSGLAIAAGIPNGNVDAPWIGYHDRNVENTYEWLDGANQGLFGANWVNGRYPPSTQYDCVYLRQYDGHWYDLHCTNNQRPFVCKRPQDPEGPLRISPCNKKMYWKANDVIYRSDMDGTDITPVISGINNTVDFQINAATQTALIGHYDITKDDVLTSYLTFVDLNDGSIGNQIIVNAVRVTSLDVDWSERKIYFTTSDPLTIQCVDFEGILTADVISQVPGFDLTRSSVKIHGDYLYYIYYDSDTDCTSTLRRVLKVPPGNDTSNNVEEVLLSGETFAHLSDVYVISCAEISPLSFLEATETVEECNQLNTVAYIQRTIVDDSNSDPNLDCPTLSITATLGTAVEEDYELQSSIVTFDLNEVSRDIPINIVCDEIVGEGDEAFTVDTIPTSSSPFTVIIRDFNSCFQFKEPVYFAMEGDTNAAVSVLRQGYLGIQGHVLVTSSSGTALSSHDFTASSLKAQFNVGEAEATVYIPILDDDVLEDEETFEIELHSPSPPTETSIKVQAKSKINVTDDDFEIKLNATHYTVAENAGSIKVPVLRIGYVDGDEAIILPVQVYENSRSAQDGVDFLLLQNSITFTKGESVKYVEISILDDDIGESNEAFRLVVTDPSKGITVLLEAHIGIADDDVSYMFSSSVYTIEEMNGLLRIPITREGSNVFEDVLEISIDEGTASAGEDYKNRGNIEVKFEPGDFTKAAFIDILDDDIGEGTETLGITLIGSNGAELDTAQVNILDNDPTAPPPGDQVYSFEVQSDFVSEAEGYRRLGVVRTRFENEGSVTFSTQSRTAIDGSDFIGVSEEVIQFNPGQERAFTSRIEIINDRYAEDDESFIGVLSQPSDGVVSNQNAIVTIEDDEQGQEVVDDVIERDGFNVSNGVLAAIILSSVVAVTAIFAMAICGCVILMKKQAATIIAAPRRQLVRQSPAYPYEMRNYHDYHR